jgi:hypothetical protein
MVAKDFTGFGIDKSSTKYLISVGTSDVVSDTVM